MTQGRVTIRTRMLSMTSFVSVAYTSSALAPKPRKARASKGCRKEMTQCWNLAHDAPVRAPRQREVTRPQSEQHPYELSAANSLRTRHTQSFTFAPSRYCSLQLLDVQRPAPRSGAGKSDRLAWQHVSGAWLCKFVSFSASLAVGKSLLIVNTQIAQKTSEKGLLWRPTSPYP